MTGRRLKHWGWGFEDQAPSAAVLAEAAAGIRERFGFGPDDFVVGYVGRFSPEKRAPRVIEAGSKLPANVTGIPMTYMMDGVQYLVMPIGAPGVPAELIAMTIQ